MTYYNSSLVHSNEFIPRLAYLFLVVIGTIFGNLLVIIAVAKFKKLRRSTNLILASLALADLMSGIVTVPLYIAWTINPEVFDKSAFLCRFVLLSCLLLVAASQVSLLFLSFERYLAVCQPFKHRHLLLHCPWLHKLSICFIWAISGIATATSSLAIKPNYPTCSYYGVFDKIFLFLAVIFGIFVVFLAIIVINIKVLYTVRDHEKRLSFVELSRSTDHRHSSYLCHQDAFDCQISPDVCIEKSKPDKRLILDTVKGGVSVDSKQPLLKGIAIDLSSAGTDNTDADDQKTMMFSHNTHKFLRGIFHSKYGQLKQKDKRRSLKALNGNSKQMTLSECSVSRSDDNFKDVTDITSEMITEKIGVNEKRKSQDGVDEYKKDEGDTKIYFSKTLNTPQTFVNRSLPDNLEYCGISSTSLVNTDLCPKHIKSTDHILQNSEVFDILNTSFKKMKRSTKNDKSTRVTNISGKNTPCTEESVSAVIASLTEFPLPLSFELGHVYQTCLNSAENMFNSNSNDVILNSSHDDDSPSSGINRLLKLAQYNNTSKSLTCVQLSPQKNKDPISSSRRRKSAKCYPKQSNPFKGWAEKKGKTNPEKFELQSAEVDPHHKEHIDSSSILSNEVIQNFEFGDKPYNSNTLSRQLRGLHLETGSCPRSNDLIAGVKDTEFNARLRLGSVSLDDIQNSENESFYNLNCLEHDDNDLEDEDDYNICNSSDCLDNHSLIPEFRSSSKYLTKRPNKYSPAKLKLTRKCRHSNKRDQNMCEVSKYQGKIRKVPEKTHNYLPQSVPNLTMATMQDSFSVLNSVSKFFNPLSLVELPISRSCTDVSANTFRFQFKTSPVTTIPSYADKVTQTNDSDNKMDEVFESNKTNDRSSDICGSQNSSCHAQSTQPPPDNSNSISYYSTGEILGKKENNEDNADNFACIKDEPFITNNDENSFQGTHHQPLLRQYQQEHHKNLQNNDYIKTEPTRQRFASVSICNTKHPNHNHKVSIVSTHGGVNNNNNNIHKRNSVAIDISRKSSSVTNQQNAYISKKVSRTVTLVCTSFILAWLPFFVVIVYNTFCAQCNLDYALNAVLMVAFGQSACNPVIYALYHASFRRAYKSLMRQLCSKIVFHVQCPYATNCSKPLRNVLDSE